VRLATGDFVSRARDLVGRFTGVPVLVAGDVMLDRFIVGRVTRISPEAPVPIVQFESEHVRLGGAANVAHNIASLGGRASLVGIVGDDPAGAKVRELLAAAGVSADGLVGDRTRPTTEKVRVVTERNQQVARIDYERDADADGDVERAIVDRVGQLGRDAKALLVSDYLKGAITRPVVEALLSVSRSASAPAPSRSASVAAPSRSAALSAASGSASRSLGAEARGARVAGGRPPLIVDPKIPHLACYAGATLVTPNHHEAEVATDRRIRTDDDAREAARAFRSRARCDAVLITRGEHGIWLSADDAEGSVPAVAREVSDVTGAGDTVVATLALALAAGATMVEAAMLANYAAGIVVGKFGPATITADELVAAVIG
jgi:D-beta-D-heptose 7-phosphate kinase/D-beta-D-heptose 1-phosphate adenosyltransferase